jgi:hypothetical protein
MCCVRLKREEEEGAEEEEGREDEEGGEEGRV